MTPCKPEQDVQDLLNKIICDELPPAKRRLFDDDSPHAKKVCTPSNVVTAVSAAPTPPPAAVVDAVFEPAAPTPPVAVVETIFNPVPPKDVVDAAICTSPPPDYESEDEELAVPPVVDTVVTIAPPPESESEDEEDEDGEAKPRTKKDIVGFTLDELYNRFKVLWARCVGSSEVASRTGVLD